MCVALPGGAYAADGASAQAAATSADEALVAGSIAASGTEASGATAAGAASASDPSNGEASSSSEDSASTDGSSAGGSSSGGSSSDGSGASASTTDAPGADTTASEPSAEASADSSGSSSAGDAANTTPAKPTVKQRLAKLNLKLQAKLQYDGWRKAVTSGKTAGTKTAQGFRMMKIKLTGLNGVSGSICYRTFTPGAGWSKQVKNGKASGSRTRAITAARIQLKGKVSKYYDVYYRTYFKGLGWFGWAKNNEVAGTTANYGYVSAMQVKLVKKGAKPKGSTSGHYLKNRWQALEHKYASDDDVNEILEVKYTGGSNAKVVLRVKDEGAWETAVSCQGYVGKRGIGETREGLARTPSGDFGITDAFGIESDPGANINYVEVTPAMYWCGDSAYYNQLIDINSHPHNCSGEHLIDYSPHYDYGLFFDYNTNPIRYGKGSAFFVHCTGAQHDTEGCIAVPKPDMIDIICTVTDGARLCIYSK